ncbi:unnamed protein product, partial [Adineta steineri]
NLWHNNNSETKITHNTASDITRDDEMDLSMKYLGTKPFKLPSLDETVSSHNHQKVQIRDAWPNWTSMHDDHHRYKKKRNKKKS